MQNNITLTKDARELLAEALRLFMSEHEMHAKKALDENDSEGFHVFANKVLSAKLVLRQITGKVR